MKKDIVVDWYFDFVSPFAYLQSTQLDRIAERATLRCRPVLFAGLLKHWGNVGPAEIAPKRQWTFEHVAWIAHSNGIALKLPPMHPFVPLPLLRLSIVLGSELDVVRRLFAFVWRHGQVPTEQEAFAALLDELGVRPESLESPQVKQTLRANTDEAIAAGVFGVPTSVIEGERYWGFDAMPMIVARLEGDAFFASDALRAARAMPEGVQREGVRRPGSLNPSAG
ncbi:MAG: 2-hydroxychromene-2-carboxylate isomerase [Burkholderiaceae bacterium]|jgi:2-hydroxychromene-2-carboxylate isomerase|nr:2-hydroxychromene-2-carboxylate isomerase [Burkholderiaceae bacterium]